MTVPLYQSAPFLDLVAEVYHLERIHPFADPALAGLTTFFTSRHKLKQGLVFSLPFNFYHSPTFEDVDQERRFFEELAAWAARHRVNVTMNALADYPSGRRVPFANNPILALSKDVERGFSKNLRSNLKRNANKAERVGLVVEVTADPADLRTFYNEVLAVQYIDKHKMVFQPFALFEGMLARGLVTVLVARYQGRVVGGLILTRDGETLHYNWGASTSPENVAVGMLMQNAAIRYAVAGGYRAFDFGSTPLSDTDLFEFKMRWGCENHPVSKYYVGEPPHLVDLNSSFGLAREVYARMPKPFLRALMPVVVPWLVS